MKIPGTDLSPSRIGLGTWAMGGWMWGGTDEERSIHTICAALERGITLIDTAPAYGQGRACTSRCGERGAPSSWTPSISNHRLSRRVSSGRELR